MAVLFAVAFPPLLFYSAHLREKGSVTGDENIVLIKRGAYGIIRHPAGLGGLILLLALPIIFAVKLPFTILLVFGEIAIVTGTYLQALNEEKL